MHSVTIQSCDIHLTNLATRMPFKYGIATMVRVPHAFIRVHARIDGKDSTGLAADLLPPKWFTKDPGKPMDEEVGEMIRVIRHACEAAAGMEADSVFNVWRALYKTQHEWAANQNLPPLLAHFGTSLVERALIEAACRAMEAPFSMGLMENQFGVRLGEIHPSLNKHVPSAFLPARPLERITIRHTIGLADPLRDQDIPSDSRLNDSLPQSLEACIQTYGLKHFKIKVTGQLDNDLQRLEQIASIISGSVGESCRFSLDGNEQFKSISEFRDFWETIVRRPALKEFLNSLLFIEQPLHRDVALNADVKEMFDDWPVRPPVIIDESDGELDCLPRALELGYAGTSHKNCKGVFKGIINRCLIGDCAARRPEERYLMSGEDLATIGPVSVIQDLAVMATLGIESVERNGHHYFSGLSMFPQEIQKGILTNHGDLYRQSSKGWPALDIQDGVVRMTSVNESPFGLGFSLDPAQFTPVDGFRPA